MFGVCLSQGGGQFPWPPAGQQPVGRGVVAVRNGDLHGPRNSTAMTPKALRSEGRSADSAQLTGLKYLPGAGQLDRDLRPPGPQLAVSDGNHRAGQQQRQQAGARAQYGGQPGGDAGANAENHQAGRSAGNDRQKTGSGTGPQSFSKSLVSRSHGSSLARGTRPGSGYGQY